IPVSLEEFPAASRDYPLVFVRPEGSDNFAAVATLGMQPRQNLFLMGDGLWDRRVYLPAYVRRYPFCMVRTAAGGAAQRLLCVETSALNGRGEALYDDNGEALPNWETLEQLIVDFEDDLERTDQLCKLLYELDLLQPFNMKAEIDGFTLKLDGMHRVDQKKLEDLPEEHLRRLFAAGAMDKLYAHLLSLQNFRRILNRCSFFALKPPTDARELN